ncbi:hypothetical protein [Bradyrhizobium sp. Tv2a-2]|uniref:hypothetical protein n=1 Tax=Bradyrhizobium sp. Tv2a-2 TaxID=113395 RepID=UPI0003F901C8|nr:hypothetical protein [Bradyrhizobium sp. Tv2a-2]
MTDIPAIASRLTIIGAINVKDAGKNEDDSCGRIHTGLGKWTHIAALGVERSLTKLGLVEVRGKHDGLFWTPLGKEVGAYVRANWDKLKFRDGRKR